MQVLLIQKPDRTLERTLREQGYEVCSVDSAVEAGPRALSGECNLVLVDLDLPGRHGLRYVREWRGSGLGARVLALTSGHAAVEKVQALDYGADAVVTKPYDRNELLAQIKALLRRPETTGPAILKVGDLELDPAARIVKRAGRFIKLTRREFDLLHLLAGNHGKIVSRSKIMAAIFAHRRLVTSNALNVHIRSLRRKVDTGFEHSLIRTCYGEGYMIRSDS